MEDFKKSKETILSSLRRNTKEVHPKPNLAFAHTHYDDKFTTFIEMCNATGGKGDALREGERIDDAVRRLFPDAKSIASNLPEVTCATFNPDDAAEPKDLNGTDLVVCRGKFGVCENGAVYFEQAFKHRAIYFISEAMVMIVDRNDLVDTMHEACARIPLSYDGEFRGFIGGPSKTADIEQALVKGAHGAKDCVMLVV